jgi:Polysaccharide lyase
LGLRTCTLGRDNFPATIYRVKILVRAVGFLLVLSFLALILPAVIPVHVYDGFESTHLSWLRWSRGRFVPGAVVPEEKIVRSGHSAVAITVRNGDRYEAASSEGAATERDELMESWWLYARSERAYVYSFSLYIPADFPQTPDRLIIAQWKQLCWRCHPDNPVLAVRYQSGRLRITRRDAYHSEELYRGSEYVRGRWLDFRLIIRFDLGDQGAIDATLDGQPIVHYRGPTVYRPPRGHSVLGLVYFKTGLYRDALREPPWTIYVDEYRKDQCSMEGSR